MRRYDFGVDLVERIVDVVAGDGLFEVRVDGVVGHALQRRGKVHRQLLVGLVGARLEDDKDVVEAFELGADLGSRTEQLLDRVQVVVALLDAKRVSEANNVV